MSLKRKLALTFFILTSVVMIIGILKNDITIIFIAKPLLMISLTVYYLVSVRKPNFWYVSALFFSFWGDTLLLFKDQYFVLGLGSFLLTHLLFIKIISRFLPKLNVRKIILHSLPFVAFLIVLMSILAGELNSLLIPVLFYGIVISVFGTLSFLIYNSNRSTENLWLFMGALLFISSDSVLAINKFLAPSEINSLIIMITYILAQFLIAKSMISKPSASF